MVKKILHLIGKNKIPNNYPISAEYIKPMGKINITSHGIGSGIYGLSRSKYNSYFDNLPEYLKDGTYVEVIINNPFILKNSEDCDKLIAWSTSLNDNLEKYKKKILSGKITLKLFAGVFVYYFNKFFTIKLSHIQFINALTSFFHDYITRSKYVSMPINYIFKELGIDGIYAEDTICDSMSKGNIKFIPYIEESKKALTNIIKVRNGVHVDKIRIPGFLYVRGFLLKHPPIFTKEYNQWKIDHGIVSYKAKSSHIGK